MNIANFMQAFRALRKYKVNILKGRAFQDSLDLSFLECFLFSKILQDLFIWLSFTPD